ncbi:MAG TPA: RNA 2',3'-cyclic phosphodiesterase [Dehalococcoidales bacterium]|nr:RNA 2',3'-cyclic phosphodiesterase [Dehalococcoidales bacterium]
MEQIRSFIAIELSGEVKQALARLQGTLKSGSRTPVRWVDPNSIHLTLKFLGNINADMTGRITAAMEEAARGVHPFRIEISGLGVFPNPGRVQIVWVGLTGEVERLGQLQKRIEAGLVPLGFAAESRSFTPHLTIGRVRDQATTYERQDLGRLIEGMSFDAGCKLDVESVNLMKSQLTREGPIYSRLGSVMLK